MMVSIYTHIRLSSRGDSVEFKNFLLLTGTGSGNFRANEEINPGAKKLSSSNFVHKWGMYRLVKA
jgi:hypothetical protein